MIDKSFYSYNGEFSVEEMACFFGVKPQIQNENILKKKITGLAVPPSNHIDKLYFLFSPEYKDYFINGKYTFVLTTKAYAEEIQADCIFVVEDSRLFFRKCLKKFYSKLSFEPLTSPIHPSSSIGKGVKIGYGTVIHKDVIIGNNTIIEENTILYPGTCIGKSSYIGSNSSISYAKIGDNFECASGVRIGQRGFADIKVGSRNLPAPHFGRVIIGDNVYIGANTTVDRGILDDTIINEGTLIGNLVLISHNSYIGKNCLVCGFTAIGGGAYIEDGCTLGGNVAIRDNVRIGMESMIYGGSNITKSIDNKSSVAGYPAIPVREWRKQAAVLKRMIKGLE